MIWNYNKKNAVPTKMKEGETKNRRSEAEAECLGGGFKKPERLSEGWQQADVWESSSGGRLRYTFVSAEAPPTQ